MSTLFLLKLISVSFYEYLSCHLDLDLVGSKLRRLFLENIYYNSERLVKASRGGSNGKDG